MLNTLKKYTKRNNILLIADVYPVFWTPLFELNN